MKKRQSLYTGVLLITAIIVIVNVLSYSYFFRLDFTRDKRYTLSKPTLTLLSDLKQPITVTAYFSDNLPPQIAQVRADFKDLLVEYAMRSGNKVVFNFVNPNKSDTLEKDAQKNGIEPTMVNIRDKDEMKKQKTYLGAVVKYGDKQDAISFVMPGGTVMSAGGPMENALSTSIKKLTITKKPFVGYLQGNGEPKMEAVQQLNAALRVLYDFQELQLTDTASIPSGCGTLVMIDPKDTFRTAQLKHLDDFMARGGHLFIAYSGLDAQLQTLSGKALNIGLAQWLASKNIVVEPKYVIDARCGSINVPQNVGGMQVYQQMAFPYLPIITNMSSHPITQGLSSVMLPFCSDVKFTGDTNKVKYVELMHTSDKTGLIPAPVQFDIQHQWAPSEFPLVNVPVAAAVSGVGGNKDAKIVLVCCGGFAVNGTGQRPMQQEEDNINIVVNSVDWLSDEMGLIELRSKTVKPTPLKDVSDSTRVILKYLNFLLPIILVIIYGAIRMQMKRRKRVKRMEEVYDKEA
ncbi:MAG TPA: Gldg family protein [Bacteroidia bacterium]|jgi:gliding-associated putative ABC transporter substrate-binding component GldG|nr:Gldg family protein [Bacteroidia bacterium]